MSGRQNIVFFVVITVILISCAKTAEQQGGKDGKAQGGAVYKNWRRLVPYEDMNRGKWGYWAKTKGRKRIIISPRFDYAEPFCNGFARVVNGGQEAYIDLAGKIVFSPQFPCSEGLICFKKSSWLSFLGAKPKYGYADRSGKCIIPPRFNNAYDFSEGLAAVRIDDKYGYIDNTGEMVINPQFTWAGPFSEGRAAVLLGDKEGYIDRSGRTVIEPRFIWADIFSEGLAAVLIGKKWGYIDRVGDIVIEPKFDEAWPFFQRFARVEAGGERYYINRRGKGIPPKTLIKYGAKQVYEIPSDGFPYSFDLTSFKTSDNIRGYHPGMGLIFNSRGNTLSDTVFIPEGRYSIRLTAKGPPQLDTERLLDLVLIPTEGDAPSWPPLIGRRMEIINIRKQYSIGPVDIPGGYYKVQVSLINDLWICKEGERYYDRNLYIKVKDISIESQ